MRDPREKSYSVAVRALASGRVIAYPTDTLYGLGARASNAAAVRRVQTMKGRPGGMPVSVAFSSTEELEDYVALSQETRALVRRLLPGPFTLLLPVSREGRRRLAPEINAGGPTLGVRVPEHPISRLLTASAGPITATSANRHGEPPSDSISAARRRFGPLVSVYVSGGPKPAGRPSEIIDATGPEPRRLRRE